MSTTAAAVNNKKDIVSIQALRGIAAFLVVLSHCFPYDHYPETNILRIISIRGGVGVQIFFIISGYIVPFSMYKKNYELKDLKVFFTKRMIRIEPPYFASILLALILGWSTTWSPWYSGPPYNPDWWNVLGHLGYLNAFTKQPWLNDAYWTLSLEFMYYIIIALFYPLFINDKKWILMLSFFTFLSLTLAHVHIPYYLLGSNTVFFTLGIALFLFHTEKINHSLYLVLTLACLLVCFVIHTPLFMFVAISTLFLIHFVKNVPKILIGLGAISYSLYLTHALIITRFIGIITRYLPNVPVSIKYTLGVVFCIAFSVFFFWVVERPFQKISKNIGYKKAPKPTQ